MPVITIPKIIFNFQEMRKHAIRVIRKHQILTNHFHHFIQEYKSTKFEYNMLVLSTFVIMILSKSTGQELLFSLFNRAVVIASDFITALFHFLISSPKMVYPI